MRNAVDFLYHSARFLAAGKYVLYKHTNATTLSVENKFVKLFGGGGGGMEVAGYDDDNTNGVAWMLLLLLLFAVII